MLNKGKIALYSVVIIIFVLFLVWLAGYLSKPSVNTVMYKTASAINEKCPATLTLGLTLDSATVVIYPSRIFILNCKLPENTDTTQTGLKQTENYFRPRLKEYTKTEEIFDFIRRHGINVMYVCRNSNGNTLMEYTVSAGEYSK